ncbi:hypothetical protein MNAN1_001039 [Malassezia nana]|uniref:4a-hydroxytetrahydrobiopterin dehydratase n=1 Tax=Malassezia nana TaxID=180528 RepID=A0AAF0J1M2_9BASI|nr:hypothetical protein MNAN1_001039 [Malassezia nana]
MATAVLRARPPVASRLLYRAMSTHLADAHCVPCSKKAIRELGLQRLGDAEAAAKLQELEPGWALQPQPTVQTSPTPELPPALHKVYRFRNFTTAAAFTQAVGAEAEAEGHHPALLLEWGSVAVWWWSHALQGLHDNDYIMAARTDRLAAAAEGRR